MRRYIYAHRPVEPGTYHVWMRDRVAYLGIVRRVATHRWTVDVDAPAIVDTREQAALILENRYPQPAPPRWVEHAPSDRLGLAVE